MQRRILIRLCWLLLVWMHPAMGAVTFESLLHEMVNRDRLATLPDPAYTCSQFSSYDRAADTPGDPATWFANADFSQFLATETVDGKTQHVMMDAEGPGAVVRFWVTWVHRPENMVRVFLDGADTPTLEAPLAEFIDGAQLAAPPLAEGVSPQTDVNRRGHNLYLPIPYAKRCKITYEGPIQGSLYYQINVRSYAPGTEVVTFRPDDPGSSRRLIAQVQRRLLAPRVKMHDADPARIDGPLAPGASRRIHLTGPAAIRELALRLQADDMEQALRSTVLSMTFDGQQTGWCPVGDFFGTGHQLHPSATWVTSVGRDGSMSCFWVMPFQRTGQVTLHNFGDQAVDVVLGDIHHSPWSWDSRSMHFFSTWREWRHRAVAGHGNHGGQGAEDANYVHIQGHGVYVGDTLTIFNAAGKWWGEGDEKIYVDGESFPSHFGTGTEDYYGYAWCRPESFSAPFHAQPSGRGNLQPGMSVNSRYRALDAIPFRQSLQVDMEIWHWAKTRMNYAPTTFWYARPGAVANVKPDPGAAAQAVARTAEDLVPMPRVPGAIEGEALAVKQCTGGTTEIQNNPEWDWSGWKQLWWKDGQPGDRLVLTFPAPTAGRFRVSAHLTRAPDYGTYRFLVNGEAAGELDGYHPEVIWAPSELGLHELPAGENELEIILTGANEKAAPRHMFGLDCLLLNQP